MKEKKIDGSYNFGVRVFFNTLSRNFGYWNKFSGPSTVMTIQIYCKGKYFHEMLIFATFTTRTHTQK